MPKLILMLAALWLSSAAYAQTPTVNPALQQVQGLAPQLLAFAGSAANLQSLVNGLTQGTPITLATPVGDGTVQIVTFAPGTPMSPADAARVLEAARQSLISRGIATPSAQQLAIALMGGGLPTSLGTTSVTGVLSGNAGATPVQVRNEQVTPGTAAAGALTAASVQAIQAGLAQNVAVTVPGTAGNVTFSAPGRPMSAAEINQALQLAAILLAQQGITTPTAEQLRAALQGGTITTVAGTVSLQGVLQGAVRNVSDSPLGTSDSRILGTSDSRVVGTSNTPPAAAAPSARVSASPSAGTSAPVLGSSTAPGTARFGAR